MMVHVDLLKTYLVLLLAVGPCIADVYLHNPRGSNNRLNENTANRKNGDRCFDSQNNNKGGYNVGDRFSNAAPANNGIKGAVDAQYQMEYRLGSVLDIEWTNQHGCGGNHFNDEQKTDCNLIFQVMCMGRNEKENGIFTTESLKNAANDGSTTQRPEVTRSNEENPSTCQFENTAMYQFCAQRQRNKGLFTADQKLTVDDATRTRQNPNGNRRGLECPEERDYFPYWAPTQWMDLAYITSNPIQCEAAMTKSQNILANRASWCLKSTTDADKPYWEMRTPDFCASNAHNKLAPNNQAECESAGCVWARPQKLLPFNTTTLHGGKNLNDHDLFAPICVEAPKTRPNHLGNTPDGEASRIRIQLPGQDIFGAAVGMQCQFRLRYNISTFDYEAMDDDLEAVVDHTYNNNPNKDYYSPVRQNPTVRYDQTQTMKTTTQGFKLAINTAQFGRTFQDRSHVFRFLPEATEQGTHYNLNVRGKRGNIVQTYPAVEYDYVPTNLWLCENDRVHVQWTGSNTHNNKAPAGDGQAGDAGEGTGGTDRSNLVQIMDRSVNYPAYDQKMWGKACADYPGECEQMRWDLMTSCHVDAAGERMSTEGMEANALLNDSPASCNIRKPVRFPAGTHHYMGTRNNNFSNRSQKGSVNQVGGECPAQLTRVYCGGGLCKEPQCAHVRKYMNCDREYPKHWKDGALYCRPGLNGCPSDPAIGYRRSPNGDLLDKSG